MAVFQMIHKELLYALNTRTGDKEKVFKVL